MIRTFALGASISLALCALAACQRTTRDLPLLEIDPGGREPRLLSATLVSDASLQGDCAGDRVLVMVFSHRLDPASIQPELFSLSAANSSEVSTPSCVARATSTSLRELRTVYAVVTAERDLERVEITGALKTAPVSWGQLTFEGTSAPVEVLDTSPALVFGERVMVANSSCRPSDAHQAVRLTWAAPIDPSDGGVSPDRFEVTIMNRDGTLDRIRPTVVEDDDGDNHHELCLKSYALPLEVHTDIGPTRIEVLY